MIKVLIVEDDPMVAEINKRYLQDMKGFHLSGLVHNVKDAITFLEKEAIELILLDVYMPGESGLVLLKYIRDHHLEIDVILITAAGEKDKVQTALRLGAVDYLIKPFEFERFKHALLTFQNKYMFFADNPVLKQQDLDDRVLSTEQNQIEDPIIDLPKGLTSSTLQVVIDVIKAKGNNPFSTDDISESTYISRVSVRKYLKFLTQLGVLKESLTYGIGRPVYLYTLRLEKLNQVDMYL
ncbi:response regulator [Robertmurraya korlensis]|uniref:response regulator n=1 Tax=Robertmurraya korlensis TaxID=519977 RepID=UPI00082649D9|nr:response regulator [Robertmurraya korlensis]